MCQRLASASVFLSGWLLCLPADAGEAARPSAPVAAALQAELEGDNAARSQFLQQTLAASDDAPAAHGPEAHSPAAHWHAGRVSGPEGEWRDFRHVPPERLAALEEYRAQRQQTGEQIADLLALADWCRDHAMADAERAHLLQILEQQPDHPQVRARLGHVLLENEWITPEQIARADQRATQQQESLDQFGETIIEWLHQLQGTRYERDHALQEVMELRDPSAIPAMEQLLSATPRTQLLLIDWLAQIDRYEAAQATARTALRTGHVEVQRAAAAKLRDRPFDQFVPVLLGAMTAPITMTSRIGLSRNGWYMLELAFESETETQRHQLVRPTQVGRQTGSLGPPEPGEHLTARRLLQIRRQQADQQRLEWNRRIRQTNQRAELVLRHVTGDVDARGPDDWWQRWIAYNGIDTSGDKPILRVTKDPERLYVEEQTHQPSRSLRRTVFGQRRAGGSCFAAGTPVWTERGAVPIEQIAVGDRVLAQEVDTGELAYQPVLGTTVRPPTPQRRITTGRISVSGTGGHPIWVNGQGWRLLRELEPGMPLHGTDGMQPLLDVASAEDAPAYNLIVADFHTYFIGEGAILCHDNTPREPTNALVPGLLAGGVD